MTLFQQINDACAVSKWNNRRLKKIIIIILSFILISTRRDDVLDIWEQLLDALRNRRTKLELHLNVRALLTKFDDWKETSKDIMVWILSIYEISIQL